MDISSSPRTRCPRGEGGGGVRPRHLRRWVCVGGGGGLVRARWWRRDACSRASPLAPCEVMFRLGPEFTATTVDEEGLVEQLLAPASVHEPFHDLPRYMDNSSDSRDAQERGRGRARGTCAGTGPRTCGRGNADAHAGTGKRTRMQRWNADACVRARRERRRARNADARNAHFALFRGRLQAVVGSRTPPRPHLLRPCRGLKRLLAVPDPTGASFRGTSSGDDHH